MKISPTHKLDLCLEDPHCIRDDDNDFDCRFFFCFNLNSKISKVTAEERVSSHITLTSFAPT